MSPDGDQRATGGFKPLSKRKKHQRIIDLTDEPNYEQNRWSKEKKIDRYKKNVIVSAQTEGQKRYIIEIKNNSIIFCIGPAGTGKTCVATGMALQALTAPVPAYEKMVIVRPIREACGEKIGWVPGDLATKMSDWIAPVMDNMEVYIDKKQIKNLFWEERIEALPLGLGRGRSFNNAFVIADEAQNYTPEQMLLLLTRIGKNSKLCINGDLDQSDISGNCGLLDAIERLQGIDGISTVEMDATDIVRHPLIAKILERYSDPETES